MIGRPRSSSAGCEKKRIANAWTRLRILRRGLDAGRGIFTGNERRHDEMNVEQLQEAALDELLRLHGVAAFELKIPADEVILIVAEVQLALTHPQNTGVGAQAARKFCNAVREFFETYNCPGCAELIRLGQREKKQNA
jgi:hypothetical protein